MMRAQTAAVQRRRQVERQKLIICLITTCIIFFGFLWGSSILASGRDSGDDGRDTFKYYTSIEVEQGDSLWSIAGDYMTSEYRNITEYIDEVKHLNRLGHDEIHIGQYITVPYYSSEFK